MRRVYVLQLQKGNQKNVPFSGIFRKRTAEISKTDKFCQMMIFQAVVEATPESGS